MRFKPRIILLTSITLLGAWLVSPGTTVEAPAEHAGHNHMTLVSDDQPTGAGAWTRLPDLPAAADNLAGGPPVPRLRQEHATLAIGAKVYAIGGILGLSAPSCFPVGDAGSGGWCITNTIDVFDTTTNTWAPPGAVANIGNDVASPPNLAQDPLRRTAMIHPNAAVVDGKIYILGGMGSLTTPPDYPWFADNFGYAGVYDPATNLWTDLPDVPVQYRRGAGAVAAHGTKIYIAGGTRCHEGFRGECATYASVTGMFTSYDTATGVWVRLPDLPHSTDVWTGREMDGIDHMPGAFYHDSMYIFGGRENTLDVKAKRVFAFNVDTNTWSERAPMPTARSEPWGGRIGNHFHVIGGAGTWDPYGSCGLPPSLGVPCPAPLNGSPGFGTFDNHEVYNFPADKWSVLPPMPLPRHADPVSGAVVGRSIYLPGGSTNEGAGPVSYFDKFTEY
ncbi:MAG: Kelch repeat-containing protein [bacterium]